MQDAAEYYAAGTHSPDKKKKKLKSGQSNLASEELKAECYIGFQKLLKDELRTFELKDSIMIEAKVNSLNQRK